ncbi:MAG: Cof-type HAD-IIB family hydrolase [Bacteroidales bacterium]|nr:Cof-type HAD-IIB family hydrolase [Bacteroidales bacterium]
MTLYATDLDGTLLGENARLSHHTARVFKALQQRGANITYVTARTPATVEGIMAEAEPRIPGVVMTGAAIWNPIKRAYEQVIYHHPASVRKIVSICREKGVTPFVYTLPFGSNQLVVYHESPQLNDIEANFVHDREVSDLKRFVLHEPLPADGEVQVVLFFAMGDPELIRVTAERIKRDTDCYVSWYPDTYHPKLALLEIFAPGVSKAAGLMRLKRMLKADEVIAFGDNLNDITMLQAADHSVATANAHPQVRAIVDEVIGSNTEDAVIRYIRDRHLGVTI